MRKDYEELEYKMLSEYAVKSAETVGRRVFEEPCPIRTEFQRDRDRIIHCNSFRRLKHKTQVFLAPMGDHYRTRLTHTLEVSQIARTIARALRLNEDLTEAIALGHDLGHTPFGHTGEGVLSDILKKPFRHNIQSVRVVDHIEKDGKGLNLTYEVKNGIACHSSGKPEAVTLEGRVVRLSDKVAYINHDIEDAVRAKVLNINDLPKYSIELLGDTKSKRITTIISDVIANSKSDIIMSPDIQKAHNELREFMFDAVYYNSAAKAEEHKARKIIEDLYSYFDKNPDKLPKECCKQIERFGKQRVVCDFISGMTDSYAVSLFEDLFVPKSWPIKL